MPALIEITELIELVELFELVELAELIELIESAEFEFAECHLRLSLIEMIIIEQWIQFIKEAGVTEVIELMIELNRIELMIGLNELNV